MPFQNCRFQICSLVFVKATEFNVRISSTMCGQYICDLVRDVETIFHLSYLLVSRASLIFQKRFPDAVNTWWRQYIASTACTRSHIAITKQKIIISKIRKNCPLKSSYVAPRAILKLGIRGLRSTNGLAMSYFTATKHLFTYMHLNGENCIKWPNWQKFLLLLR